MHNSTRAYVKRKIQKLMTECDISLEDIQLVIDKMKADDYIAVIVEHFDPVEEEHHKGRFGTEKEA